MLLELGVSHAQIKDYMQMNSPEKERRMLCNQEKMIRDEIAKLSGALDVITTRLGSIDEAESNSTGISIKHLPASPVFISHSLNGISRTDISDDTWMEFYAACEENGNSFGYPEGFMIKEESIRMGASDNIDHIVSYVGNHTWNLRHSSTGMGLVWQAKPGKKGSLMKAEPMIKASRESGLPSSYPRTHQEIHFNSSRILPMSMSMQIERSAISLGTLASPRFTQA